MRKSLVLASLFVLVCGGEVLAGVPDPLRSGTGLSTPAAGCQYRFRANGGLDTMTLCVTLRDGFTAPVAACSTSATIGSPSIIVGDCGGLTQTGFTDGAGVVYFYYQCVSGRGDATIDVVAHCSGDIAIGSQTFTFTNSDMNASNEAGASTDVVDLGIWAGCYTPSPYCVASDFNCASGVDVVDLGLWAGGLGIGCSSCP
ncbi:MAG: hypothetical protein DHS20C21_19800 [Gemmatimonadota bacterium]|nr:MAG: hypothetical protein DHS20C21_19800 [Gemmatimonadota bacterium]